MARKLVKNSNNKFFFGVCSGYGDYFNCDPTIIRILFVLLIFLKGAGFLLYVISALIMPSDKKSKINTNKETENEKKSEKKDVVPHNDEDFNSFFS